MERMIESRDIKHMACVERIKQLEEENKNLKEEKEIRALNDRDNLIQIEKLKKESKKLKEDVDYFRQCYLDLKKLCEKEGFILSDDEVTKMFNLDKIK